MLDVLTFKVKWCTISNHLFSLISSSVNQRFSVFLLIRTSKMTFIKGECNENVNMQNIHNIPSLIFKKNTCLNSVALTVSYIFGFVYESLDIFLSTDYILKCKTFKQPYLNDLVMYIFRFSCFFTLSLKVIIFFHLTET